MHTPENRYLAFLHALMFGIALWAAATGSARDGAAQLAATGPASTALAGGGPAYVHGAEAIFRNPANLVLDRGPGIEMLFGAASVSIGGNLLQFNHYNSLFTGGHTVTEEEARRVVDDWFDGAGSIDLKRAGVSAETIPLAIIHGTRRFVLGYALRMRAVSSVGINGGWLDLLLSGTGTERSIPLHGDFGVLSTTEISVAVGRMLQEDRLAIGVSPKLILGNEFSDARLRSTAVVSDEALVHFFDYSVRAAGGLSRDVVDDIDVFSADFPSGGAFRPRILSTNGIGLGVDLGVTFLPSPGLRLSASITDAGFVRWKGDAQKITPAETRFAFEGLVLDIDRVRAEFDGDVGDYFVSTIDSLASGAYDQAETTYSAFTSGLPTTIHFGASWIAPGGRLLVAGGTSAPISSSPIQVSSPPELHVGAEYALGGTIRVPLRAGVFMSGSSAVAFAFGFGLHSAHYDLDVGFSATPRTDLLGAGGRYKGAVSAVTIRF